MKFVNLMENNFKVGVINTLRKVIARAFEVSFSIERNKVRFQDYEKLRTLNERKIYM